MNSLQVFLLILVFGEHNFAFLVEIYLGMEFLGHRIHICLALVLQKVFKKLDKLVN